MRKTLALISAVALAGCSAAQVTQTETALQGYQAQIAAACQKAMPFSTVPYIGTYILAGCGTEQAIAMLALNPTSLDWVNQLLVKAQQPIKISGRR